MALFVKIILEVPSFYSSFGEFLKGHLEEIHLSSSEITFLIHIHDTLLKRRRVFLSFVKPFNLHFFPSYINLFI